MSGTVDNLPFAQPAYAERQAIAAEAQAEALRRQAAAVEAQVTLLQALHVANGISANPAQAKADRFESMVKAVLVSRIATSVETAGAMAQELIDLVDRQYPVS